MSMQNQQPHIQVSVSGVKKEITEHFKIISSRAFLCTFALVIERNLNILLTRDDKRTIDSLLNWFVINWDLIKPNLIKYSIIEEDPN